MIKRIALLVALVLAVGVAGAPTPVEAGGDKYTICHRTASPSGGNQHNGWNIQRVDFHSMDAHLGWKHAGPAPQHPPKRGRNDRLAVRWSDGSYHCAPEPKPERLWSVSGYVCGDPRVVFRVENTGNVPLEYRVRFVSAKTHAVVRTPFRTLAPGESKVVKRWVLGRSYAWVRIRGDGKALQLHGRRDHSGRSCPAMYRIAGW